ncbi:ATP-binding protein [Alicyclobacillus mengziensis]|uniref:ATP-binding protein n=1 Tax=Alicyclobacillus mengziensis TaxID=2931921 RepID=A0A9X7Z6D3_9BACL|nr:ATP-binding protein [Alicyclobacillus mengziensis]QSO47869.1 ATP-binding protein [Alicyclobacillus mengziensis]
MRLMVCHRIIDRHGGVIQYQSSSNGTIVTITLPKTSDEASGPPSGPLSAPFDGPERGNDTPLEPSSAPAV